MPENKKTTIFLSYAHENLDMVRRIDEGLQKRNLDIWFDKRCLKPGSWKKQIEKAIPKCSYFVICISDAALRKTGDEPGFQDDELQQAYEIARAQPEHSFAIVPVRLEDCGRGDHRLSPWQQYDLFDEFELGLDSLAIDLGGISIASHKIEDTRTDDDKLIQNIFNKAITFYFAGDFHHALILFDSIISIKPDSAEAWINKGNVLDDLNRKEEAISSYSKAVKIKPNSHEAWYNKGYTLDDLGRKQEAIRSYEKALELKPDLHEAWYNKGYSLDDLGYKKEAIAAYDKALEIKPGSHEAWYNKGYALVDLGRYKEATIAYDKALEIKPVSHEAWYNKGYALNKLGRTEEAIIMYDKALNIKPDKHQAWSKKGNALAELGRHEEAITAYGKAQTILEKIGSPDAKRLRSKIAEQKKNLQKR